MTFDQAVIGRLLRARDGEWVHLEDIRAFIREHVPRDRVARQVPGQAIAAVVRRNDGAGRTKLPMEMVDPSVTGTYRGRAARAVMIGEDGGIERAGSPACYRLTEAGRLRLYPIYNIATGALNG